MKHLIKTMAFTLLGLVLSVNLVWGAEGDKHTLYDATLTWATSYNQYSNTIQRDATVGACWEYASNNSKGWAYLRMCPGKNKTNTSHIGTVTATTVKTKSIDITIVAKATTTINSAKLYVYGGYSSTETSYANVYSTQKDVVTINTSDIKAGTLNITPSSGTSWESGVYFVLEINLTNGNNNNGIDVSKFVVTEASSGTSSGKDVTITADGELNLTAEESDGTISVTYGEDVADKDINLYNDAECKTSFTGDWFTADFDASGNVEYVAEANTGAAREAYIQIYVIADDGETENTKVIKVTQEEYKEPTGTFNKFTGDNLKEGDYVICVGTDAMKNSVTSSRLDYASVTVSSDKITNPDASVIWHIAPAAEGNWSIFNTAYDSNKGGYAAGTGTKNQAGILAATTDVSTETKAQWTCAKVTNGYNFENVANKAKEVNSKLQKNGTYGFACYGTFSDITLYKKYVEPAKNKVTLDTEIEHGTINATPASGTLESVEEDVVVTLTNTPASGYKLDAYKVYKTGDESTTVNVEDSKFKMPAYGVTVSATFSLSIETPVLSEAAGDKDDAINVKVSNYNGDYFYYYTLDGTDPTNASTLYVDVDGIAINASCTLKVIAYKGDVTSPVVSATYNLPLMTMDAIFAKATAAGKTATDARVKFTDCVITGVKNNNAYLTDNAGKGLIIYASSHGFEVNDKLNGAVNVKVQLYNGSAELTELTSSTSGLTITKDGSVSPITTIGIASLSGVNTGAVLSYENLTYDGEYFSDGMNGIKPYNNFNIEDYPTFENGDKYNVTGVYIQFNGTKEIAPRSLADLQKIAAQKYAINLSSVEHGSISTTPETEAADGIKVTLSATPDAGYMLGEWSVVDEDSNPVEVVNNQFTMPAKAVTVSATFVELPIWATTYTSNVTVGTDKVRFSEDGEQYDAKKAGASGSAGSTTITIPAGTYAIHFHAAGWSSEEVTLAVKKGETELGSFDIPKDAGMSNNSPYTLANDPAMEEYFMVNLSDITEETTITFAATKGKRFAIYGVNALAPAAITIDPASKNFGEVKQGFDAEQVFTLTPNAFATGTITAEIDGDNVFTTGTVAENKVTVTFAPTEIKDYSATLIIKHDGTQMCTAALSGKGIAATTPEIAVSTDEIDFGKVKQDASVTDKTVTVTLSYLDAATASISEGAFTINKTNLVAGENTITISASASSMGEKNATITITGEGATTKTIAVTMDVVSKWADVYTTDANITMSSSQNAKVKIGDTEFDAVKANDAANATITLPEGVTSLHFHAASWNGETVTLTAYKGTETTAENKLGEFELVSDGGIKSNSPYTLTGDNYSTEQYFHIDGLTDITEGQVITFVPNDNRYVIYGVNQEGGVTTVLQSIEIQGTATALNYEIGQSFDPKGLKVVGTFKKGEEDPTSRDLTTAEFDWSFDPAQFNEENESASVTVTASAKENTAITANKTIENIVVIAPVVEISTTTTKVDFGTVAQNATVDNELVYVTFKNCTEASVALSGDDAANFTIDANKVKDGDYNWVTVAVADGVTATAGTYSAVLTISADGAIADIVLPVTLIVEAPETCDGSDDFDQDQSGTTTTTYGNRNTTNGWTAVNTAIATIGVAPNTEKFFTINGKTSAVGVITSPELEGGLASLKIRYANTFQEANGVSFRVDIKQGEDVVKTYTITKANDDVAQNTVYTETISDINVAGKYQIVITNLSPSNNSSNKDRVSIGRLCITEYADFARDVEVGHMYTFCPEKDAESISGAEFYEAKAFDGSYVTFEEAENVQAGYGYLMVATEEKVQLVYADMDAITEAVSASAENGMQGVLKGNKTTDKDGFQFTETSYNHAVVVNNHLQYVGALNIIPVGRAYVNLSVISGQPTPAAPMHKCMRVGFGGQAPTDINNLNGATAPMKVLRDGQLYIIRDTKTYNAQGIEVQ